MSFDDTADRETPTVPTDHQRAAAGLRRDPVIALRVHGSGQEVELPAGSERIVLGAGSSCEVVLDDPYLSARHCVLERRGAGLVVRDCGSKNGTYVNGHRVEVAELAIGAVLTIGHTGLVALGRRSRQARSAREALVGEDPGFVAALEQALRAGATSCNVLLVGETGTGKELFARAIHEASGRALGPFVALNCGAIPPELVESELFGHEKGAFTGAAVERDGVFVQADRGTLFLDELGELPRSQQPQLLRALETRRVRRVGGSRERAVDIRLVSATNRLDLESPSSPLRTDLYHRLATLVIDLPPLRRRRGDVPLLVASFLAELEPEFGPREVGAETMAALQAHRWPGNVRELRHAVHRAVALSSHRLRLEDLLPAPRRRATPLETRPVQAGQPAPRPPPAGTGEPTTAVPEPVADLPAAPINLVEAAMEKMLLDAYRRHGSVRKAARSLGMPKSTFAERLRRLAR